ncbi:MAG: discoidin domain-containing protein, partial [Prevotellaceae bacterium]|nr:discoidin domain-containing protein [Prevotellaceae bacterium]
YGPDGKKLKGTIIGTQGESWAKKENVFDGNILTGFGANSPDGNWVGLQLNKPSKISKIKYIGRNDGNGIEIGDEYELYYWNSKGFWELLETQQATDNALYYSNIPSNGLYILKDVTKGVEERIFTYENGKQVWR